MLRIKDHVNKLAPAVAEDLKKLDAGDPAAAAEVIGTVQKHVDKYGKEQTLAPIDAQRIAAGVTEAAALQLQAEGLGQLADLAAKTQLAATALKKANEISRHENELYARFSPRDFEGVPAPAPAQLASALAGVASFAGTLGSANAHDFWYRRSVGNTELGPENTMTKSQRVKFRETMMPFEVIVDQAGDLQDDLLHRVLNDNRGGIANALRAITLALGGQKAPDGGAQFEAGLKRLTDPFADVAPSFTMPREVVAHLHRIGAQLEHLHQAAERDPNTIPWAQYPDAYDALKLVQALWAKTDIEGKRRYKEYKAFDELTPSTAARNIPALLAAVDAALRSRQLIGDLLTDGVRRGESVSPSDDAFMLQLHLTSGSKQALVARDEDSRNKVHARVVADESMLGAAIALGVSEKDGAVLTRIHDTFLRAAVAAGAEFKEGGRGASGAAYIAIDYAGELLKAVHPESKEPLPAFQRRALDLISRASLDDIAAVVRDGFGREAVPEKDAALRDRLGKLGDDLKDEWFAGLVRKLPVAIDQKKPLDEGERSDLGMLLRLANVTWKAGQIHRAAAGNDQTRIDPYKRGGVYRPYDLLVSPQGSVYESIYVVAKDLHELIEKGAKAEAAK